MIVTASDDALLEVIAVVGSQPVVERVERLVIEEPSQVDPVEVLHHHDTRLAERDEVADVEEVVVLQLADLLRLTRDATHLLLVGGSRNVHVPRENLRRDAGAVAVDALPIGEVDHTLGAASQQADHAILRIPAHLLDDLDRPTRPQRLQRRTEHIVVRQQLGRVDGIAEPTHRRGVHEGA